MLSLPVLWLYRFALPIQQTAHDGNLGRSPGMDSEWTIPGRYSVVECCLNVDKISVNTNIINISRST